MGEGYLGRQPVFSASGRVKIYEVLHASAETDAGALPSEQPTLSVLRQLLQAGWRLLVEDKPFILPWNGEVERELLPRELPRGRLVLAVDHGVGSDPQKLRRLEELSAAGYQFLLDDWQGRFGEDVLLKRVDFVRFRWRDESVEDFQKRVTSLPRCHARRMVKGVETPERRRVCGALSLPLLQGDWLCQPDPDGDPVFPGNHLVMLRLLSALNDPHVSIEGVEELVRQDVGLSYRLVRLVNSAAYGLRHEVDSIGQAVMMVGLRQLKTWVSLLTLQAVRKKPEELVTRAMVRAFACESMALRTGHRNPDVLFTIGLFSVLDALLDMPMEKVLENLPLAPQVVDPLLGNHETREGRLLACMLHHERGEFGDIDPDDVALDPTDITECFLDALVKADEAISALEA